MLCPSCMHQNLPEVDFCANCLAPLGRTTAIDPIKSIYARGFIYRQARVRPSRRTLIGMWLIFGPALLFPLFSLIKEPSWGVVLFFAIPFPIAGVLLYRVTRSYIATQAAQRDVEDSPLE